MSVPQLVGLKCVSCQGRIDAQEGVFCNRCGNPVHIGCLNLNSTPDSDGLCSSCGGEPSDPVALQVRDARRGRETLRNQWAFVGWMMTGVLFGLAALICSRALFDLPPPHPTLGWLWLIIAPISGAVLFCVIFLLSVKRYPAAARMGLYLVYLISILLAACVLIVKWATTFSK
jgi:hypothetical protein